MNGCYAGRTILPPNFKLVACVATMWLLSAYEERERERNRERTMAEWRGAISESREVQPGGATMGDERASRWPNHVTVTTWDPQDSAVLSNDN